MSDDDLVGAGDRARHDQHDQRGDDEAKGPEPPGRRCKPLVARRVPRLTMSRRSRARDALRSRWAARASRRRATSGGTPRPAAISAPRLRSTYFCHSSPPIRSGDPQQGPLQIHEFLRGHGLRRVLVVAFVHFAVPPQSLSVVPPFIPPFLSFCCPRRGST
jgi:hypothetical protein